MNVSIVIQGGLHQHSLNNLEVYKKMGPVVISCMEGDNLDYIPDKKIPVVTSSREILPYVYNQQNVYYQVLTTLAGLEKVDTEFVLKVRSDHSIGSIQPFLDAAKIYPDRYICSNLHFRPDNIFKFHASDKFIMAKTADLLACFRLCKERCENQAILLNSGIYESLETALKYPKGGWGSPVIEYPAEPLIGVAYNLPWGYVGVYPEVLIATSWLTVKGNIVDRSFSKQLMSQNFYIVDMNQCAPYLDKNGVRITQHNWEEIHHIDHL